MSGPQAIGGHGAGLYGPADSPSAAGGTMEHGIQSQDPVLDLTGNASQGGDNEDWGTTTLQHDDPHPSAQ